MKKTVFVLFLSAISFIAALTAASAQLTFNELLADEDDGAFEDSVHQNPTLSLVKILRDPHAPTDQFLLVFTHGINIIATQYVGAKDEIPVHKIHLPDGRIMWILHFGNIVLRRFEGAECHQSGVYQSLTIEDCATLSPVHVCSDKNIQEKFSESVYIAPEKDILSKNFECIVN